MSFANDERIRPRGSGHASKHSTRRSGPERNIASNDPTASGSNPPRISRSPASARSQQSSNASQGSSHMSQPRSPFNSRLSPGPTRSKSFNPSPSPHGHSNGQRDPTATSSAAKTRHFGSRPSTIRSKSSPADLSPGHVSSNLSAEARKWLGSGGTGSQKGGQGEPSPAHHQPSPLTDHDPSADCWRTLLENQESLGQMSSSGGAISRLPSLQSRPSHSALGNARPIPSTSTPASPARSASVHNPGTAGTNGPGALNVTAQRLVSTLTEPGAGTLPGGLGGSLGQPAEPAGGAPPTWPHAPTRKLNFQRIRGTPSADNGEAGATTTAGAVLVAGALPALSVNTGGGGGDGVAGAGSESSKPAGARGKPARPGRIRVNRATLIKGGGDSVWGRTSTPRTPQGTALPWGTPRGPSANGKMCWIRRPHTDGKPPPPGVIGEDRDLPTYQTLSSGPQCGPPTLADADPPLGPGHGEPPEYSLPNGATE